MAFKCALDIADEARRLYLENLNYEDAYKKAKDIFLGKRKATRIPTKVIHVAK
ncbi:hypothetical protein [Clostridium sp. M14]|uniref:hypothetical protein n=1 Tax=Clostridium sp. M14 TaxID=2716311 RepID=UPI0013EE56AD|nr:hypothetical protein [Clostridium sp. M14]MBZ9690858.1 hypothetical protein [Clostridium sp. M14]